MLWQLVVEWVHSRALATAACCCHWRGIAIAPACTPPAVCAKFEQQHERFPGAADVPALAALKSEVCAAAGVDPSALPDDQLAAYASAAEDMPAINAVVGGVLGNEVIRAAGGRDAPLHNFFLFSLAEGVGAVETMGC